MKPLITALIWQICASVLHKQPINKPKRSARAYNTNQMKQLTYNANMISFLISDALIGTNIAYYFMKEYAE